MIFRQIIIDDVLPDPQAVREQIRFQDWHPQGDGYYQGRSSMEPVFLEPVARFINRMFPDYYHVAPYSTRFRLARRGEELANTIHCDFGVDVSGILYMTPDSSKVWTSFYREQFGFDNLVDLRKKHPDYSDEMLFEDFKRPELWTEIYRIEGRFNRLAMFDSALWHGPSLAFGSDFDSGRLVQVYFLNQIPQEKG